MKQSEELTAEESLRIITDMINKTKAGFHDNSFYFLLWGWVTALAYLGHFILDKFDLFYAPYSVWLITIPAFIASMIYGMRADKKRKVSSYTGHIIMWLWLGTTFSIIIIIAFGFKTNFMITPLILTITAIPTFVSGLILKFKPLIFGGSGFWIFAALAFAFPFEYQPVFGAMAVITGYLIPGYMLKKRI